MAKKRVYGQYCGLAGALDLLGERWTLLVIRDLLLGPQRYTDLLEGLPGIGPNVLAKRLKDLQEAGVVRRSTLPPPAASTVYELTEGGRELEPAVVALGRWGLNLFGPPGPTDELPPARRMLSGLRVTFNEEAARGVDDTYEFRVGGHTVNVHVDDGKVNVRNGPASEPDLVIESDTETLIAITWGQITPEDAVAQGKLTLEGDPQASVRCAEIFNLTPRKALAGP